MLPRYDRHRDYEWNYATAPDWDDRFPEQTDQPINWPGDWRCLGRKLSAPIAVAAGPLLNGRWANYYARLGFDYVTYKTVRNRSRKCYPMPNLQPVSADRLADPGQILACENEMRGNWAISFGMPSQPIEVWQRDVVETRRKLPSSALLAVSVVATPDPSSSISEVADDYSLCAQRAVEAGADAIELNLSCPNVSSTDGQLFRDPIAAGTVVQKTRQRIANVPLLIKVGYLPSVDSMSALVASVAGDANAIVTVNCLSAHVSDGGAPMFDGELRGIGGPAILEAAIHQVEMAAAAVENEGAAMEVIGCGGARTYSDVTRFLSAGASTVQLGTAVMLEPRIGLSLREDSISTTE